MRQTSKLFVMLGVVLALGVAGAAEPPEMINFQAVLRDAANVPIDGTFEMELRLYDGPTTDNFLLIDSHVSSPVSVSGGLLSVAIGSGQILSGNMADAFRDSASVWLEVRIDPGTGLEVLQPRIRLASSAYAFNAAHLGGVDAEAFPQLDMGGDLLLAGALTVDHNVVINGNSEAAAGAGGAAGILPADPGLKVHGDLAVNGTILMDFDGDEMGGDPASQDIWFWNNGDPMSESISWIDARAGFVISAPLLVQEHLRSTKSLLVGSQDDPIVSYNRFGSVSYGSPSSGDIGNSGDVFVANDLEFNGQLYANGEILVDDDGDGSGGNVDQTIWFWNDGNSRGEFLQWDDGPAVDMFRLSNNLVIEGNIVEIGGGSDTDNDRLTFDGIESIRWIEGDHLFRISNDLKVDGNLEIGASSSGNDTITFDDNETLLFNDTDDRFEMSDGLWLSSPLFVGPAGEPVYSYNRLSSSSGSDPTSGWMNNRGDLYVQADFEVGDDVQVGDELWADFIEAGTRIYTGKLDVGWSGGLGILRFWGGGGDTMVSQSDTFDTLDLHGSVHVSGTLTALVKLFLQNHPYRPDLELAYVTLEGDEAGTYTRGSGRLVDGLARVPLGETFALVTNPDIGLTAQVTPRGAWADLYVESISTTEIVVRSANGALEDAVFDYVVHGLRIGYEEHSPVRARTAETPVPSTEYYERHHAEHPELREFTAMSRFKRMAREITGEEPVDFQASASLRDSIGVYDPDLGPPVDAEFEERMAARAGQSAEQDRSEAAEQPDSNDQPGLDPEPRAVTGFAGGIGVDPTDDVHARAPRPSSPDPAEYYPVSEPVEAGDVVVMDPDRPGHLRKGDRAADRLVAGIVSAVPDAGSELRAEMEPRFEEAHAPVALGGIVPCKVDAGYGAIAVGDLLQVSPTPGHAMRVDFAEPGMILGKAFENLEEGTGVIRVLVMLR